jgi:hypothetical protein
VSFLGGIEGALGSGATEFARVTVRLAAADVVRESASEVRSSFACNHELREPRSSLTMIFEPEGIEAERVGDGD